MSNQNQEIYYGDESGTAMVQSPAMGIAPMQQINISKPNSYKNKQLAIRAENTASHEHFRARLAGEAIVNTASLCATGDAVVNAVPSSRESVRTIIHGYASSAADRIVRW